MTAPATAKPLALRVTVTDAWRVVALSLPPQTPVAELKRRALEGAGIGASLAAHYVVKVGGAPVLDEAIRLDAAGVPDGAGMVVLPRRRRAVR